MHIGHAFDSPGEKEDYRDDARIIQRWRLLFRSRCFVAVRIVFTFLTSKPSGTVDVPAYVAASARAAPPANYRSLALNDRGVVFAGRSSPSLNMTIALEICRTPPNPDMPLSLRIWANWDSGALAPCLILSADNIIARSPPVLTGV
jgi:hypothetical protein